MTLHIKRPSDPKISTQENRFRAPIWNTSLASIIWCTATIMLWMLTLLAEKIIRICRNFKLELPALSRLIFNVILLLTKYWLWIPVIPAVIALPFLIGYSLRAISKSPDTYSTNLHRAFCTLIAVSYILISVTLWGIISPFLSLLDSLTGGHK